jgi:cysteine desulfurase
MDAIYLDNAATTPIDPRVIEEMLACMGPDADFANASAVSHAPGRQARARIEVARSEVGTLVGASPDQVVWTSGATEANNLAIFGAARFHRAKGAHLVTARTEHPSVLDPCRRLEREGFEVAYLHPGPDGIVEPAQVEAALRSDTILASLMHVNNETGVVQDVGEIGRICRSRGVLLHVDAAQGAGKLEIDVVRDRIDLLAFTAHKLNGPKGVGALCVRREPRLGLVPLIYGGGQERGLRSGTLANHQVAGFGAACRIAAEEMLEEGARVTRLRERLWSELRTLPGIWLNGSEHRRAPGILNVSIEGVEGESLLLSLSDLAVSSGSACATLRGEPSYVLRALGRSEQLAQGSLRISLGRFTTPAEVDRAAERIRVEVDRLRAIAPSPAAAAG